MKLLKKLSVQLGQGARRVQLGHREMQGRKDHREMQGRKDHREMQDQLDPLAVHRDQLDHKAM
jgi:hypothetical protein